MHKPAIIPLVFARLFPNVKNTDPTTFQAFISRNLVPEVRIETARFYGSVDCLEAQYPGLDYSDPAHRLRLGHFQWHRRLFRVFNELRLSEFEIQTICRWEGTKWARDRYEREAKAKIRDTTWDDVEQTEHEAPIATMSSLMGIRGGDSLQAACDESGDAGMVSEEEGEEGEMGESEEEEREDEDLEEESEDELQDSIGVDLNRRLMIATEAQIRGEQGVVFDSAWEQWLRQACERSDETDMPPFAGPSIGQSLQPTPGAAYGRVIPAIFRSPSDSLAPSNLSALRASMSPPPPFIPSAQSVPVLGPSPSATPTGTAM